VFLTVHWRTWPGHWLHLPSQTRASMSISSYRQESSHEQRLPSVRLTSWTECIVSTRTKRSTWPFGDRKWLSTMPEDQPPDTGQITATSSPPRKNTDSTSDSGIISAFTLHWLDWRTLSRPVFGCNETRSAARDASGNLGLGSGSGSGEETEVVGRAMVCSKRPVDVDAAAK
jgi:hypothetical protein